jgi:outer membrane receptor protein involved in Fe transport
MPESRRDNHRSDCRRASKVPVLAAAALAIFAADISIGHAQVAEVVVTARKREENVQNIPVAVTPISGAQVEKFNLTSVEDVAQQTPQLIIARGSSGSGADISMRGIGAASENIGIEQSVAVNVDGVYYGQGRAIDEGLFDVSGVQVLKGPQALFYGKNATAGAIAVQTNDPTQQYAASVTAGYEFTAQEPYVEGYASGPVAENFSMRLAFRLSDQNAGYLRNTATGGAYSTLDSATFKAGSFPTEIPTQYLGGDKNDLVRLTAKWTPTDRLTITAKATFNQLHSNNNADNTVNVYCPLGYPQSEAGLAEKTTCGKQFAAPQLAIPTYFAQIPGSLFAPGRGQDFEHYQDGNVYLRVNYEGEHFTVTSTSAFQHIFNDWADDQAFSNDPAVFAAEHFDWDQFSTEERVNTSFQFPINFAGGAYFQTTALHFNQDVDFAGAQNTAASPTNEFVAYSKLSATTGHTYAVFGQGIWEIVHNLELTGGARYTHETKDSYFEQPYVNPFFTGLFIPDTGGPSGACQCDAIGAHQTFNNVSPEAALTWKATPDLTVYGAYKTGYKSGGFSNSGILSTGTYPSDLQFKPEISKGFEFGVKSIWFDRQLRLNADVFDFLYSNLQVDFFNTPTFNYVTLNAASARTYGVEFEGDYAPKAIPGLLLHVDGAYDNSHYGQFEAPCSPAGLTYEQGCNALRVVSANGSSYSFSSNCGTAAVNCNFMDVNGRPTALSPRWTGVLGADYSRDVSSKLKADVAVNVRLSTGYVATPFPSGVAEQIDHQSAYGAIDAVISLASLNNHWKLSVIGRNLTNTFIETSTAGLPLSGGTSGCKVSICGPQTVADQGATVENPRTVAIQLNYKY